VPPRPAALTEGALVELSATPYFPQDAHECGPAALATLLGAAGRETTPDALVPFLIVPERQGSLQPELLAQARHQGFIALPIAPHLDALVAELRAGRPVLVLQNNALSWYTMWHYAVAIGYDPVHDTVVLRSGVTERMVLPRKTFERTWARAERWGFVLLAAGQLPAEGTVADYARAVAAFEATAVAAAGSDGAATPVAAARAWEAGRSRWPESWELAFGLGNRRYADGALSQALAAFTDATRLAPKFAPAWNNLAVAYMDAGRWDEALVAAQRAAALSDAPDITTTLREARCRRAPDCR
jgi:tetratricopeptide (TPR) repeat protein